MTIDAQDVFDALATTMGRVAVGDPAHLMTFEFVRPHLDGPGRRITLTLRDYGPHNGRGRFTVEARDERQRMLASDRAATLQQAFASVAWDTFDHEDPADTAPR